MRRAVLRRTTGGGTQHGERFTKRREAGDDLATRAKVLRGRASPGRATALPRSNDPAPAQSARASRRLVREWRGMRGWRRRLLDGRDGIQAAEPEAVQLVVGPRPREPRLAIRAVVEDLRVWAAVS